MAKLPAADTGSGSSAGGADFTSPTSPSAFQRELDRARRHLAKLEAEQQLRAQRPAGLDEPVRFDESPAFARTCNLLIWAIVLLPILLAVIGLVRRILG